MDAVEYWQRQAREMTKEYELVLQSQRNEIETLQRRCGELMYENQMMKASTAADIRQFILNYQANAAQLKNSNNANKATSSSPSSISSAFSTRNDRNKSGTATTSINNESRQLSAKIHPDHIPVALILKYLHDYSNGLVSGPENKRKRGRISQSLIESPRSLHINTNPSPSTSSNNNNMNCKSSPPNSPFNTFHNRRLHQRMLTRCFRHRPRESDLELMSEDEEEELETQLRYKQNVNVHANTNSESGAFAQTQGNDETRNKNAPQYSQPFSVAQTSNNVNNNNNNVTLNSYSDDSSKTWCNGNINNNSKNVNKIVATEQKISLFRPFQP